jgi:hypothetical protein
VFCAGESRPSLHLWPVPNVWLENKLGWSTVLFCVCVCVREREREMMQLCPVVFRVVRAAHKSDFRLAINTTPNKWWPVERRSCNDRESCFWQDLCVCLRQSTWVLKDSTHAVEVNWILLSKRHYLDNHSVLKNVSAWRNHLVIIDFVCLKHESRISADILTSTLLSISLTFLVALKTQQGASKCLQVALVLQSIMPATHTNFRNIIKILHFPFSVNRTITINEYFSIQHSAFMCVPLSYIHT